MANQIALITGGSRGIGAAIALELAKNNVDIVITFQNSEREANLVVNEAIKIGVRAMAIRSNAGDEKDITSLFEKVRNEFGNISYLVNNAALSSETIAIEEIGFTELDKIFKINFFGTVISCKEALKQMKEVSGNKAIVNISSEAANLGGRSIMAHYASSKSAVNTFTKSIAREFAQYGIRVNAVSPAVIDTDTHKDISNERREHFNKTIPMKRMGTPEEVAKLVFFLLSQQASYINGEVISINGGK